MLCWAKKVTHLGVHACGSSDRVLNTFNLIVYCPAAATEPFSNHLVTDTTTMWDGSAPVEIEINVI